MMIRSKSPSRDSFRSRFIGGVTPLILPERKTGRACAVAAGAFLAVALLGLGEWLVEFSPIGRVLAVSPVLGLVLLAALILAGFALWWRVARLHRRLRRADESILQQAGEEARAAEARFRSAFFDSPIPAILWTDRGDILTANRRWTELSGYSRDDIPTIGEWTRVALCRPPTADLAASLARRFSVDTWVGDGEREIRTKSGDVRVWDFHTALIGSMPAGERLLVSKGVDVTASRSAEERYRMLNAELERRVLERTLAATTAEAAAAAALRLQRAVLDGTVFSIISTQPDGTILTFNAGAESMLQYSREEMIGRQTPSILHDAGEVAARAAELSAEFGRTVDPGFEAFVARTRLGELDEREWTYVRKDGSRLPVLLSITALRGADGAIEGFLGIARDITARKAAMSALARSEERFRHAFEYAGIGMALIGLDGRWLRVNSAICEIVGYDETTLMTKTFQDITHPEDLEADLGHVRELLAGTCKHYQMEKRYFHRTGRTIWIRLTASLVRDEHAAPLYFVSQIEDITERKRLERRLAEARDAALEASRMKSGFLANMSHEIRTPMNAVVAMSGLLVDTPLTATQREMVEAIRGGADALLKIIDDALDFSRIEAGKLRLERVEFDLARSLADAVRLLAAPAQAKGLSVGCEIDPALGGRVWGDAGRVRQVFTNLLGNAIKFTERGSVAVEAGAMAASVDRLRVRVAIHDSGVGIGQAERPRLFLPFERGDDSTTRRFGGTGLGLSISRQLVEMMGGQIGFESEPGLGSTFWFELEFARAHAPESCDVAVPSQPGRRLTVLAIDDHPTNRRVIELLVRKLGHEVELAADGHAGLARLAEGGIDAVLTDCQMPGMDGYEVARCIRAGAVPGLDPRIPLVAVTAYASATDRLRMLGEGMDEHLTKPLDAHSLACVLEDIAQGRRPGQRPVSAPLAPPPAVVEVFDRRALEVVRGLPGSKGGSLLPELIALFWQSEEAQLSLLARQLAAREGEAAGATAHAIAGNVAAFGGAELKACLLMVEHAARSGRWEDAGSLLAAVQSARERLHRAIEEEGLLTL